jgi:hypothetical protein
MSISKVVLFVLLNWDGRGEKIGKISQLGTRKGGKTGL